DRQRLVVIGNGMVGARFVEALLARGGGDRYEVVMFGDEPTGNYNRILLPVILAGTHEVDDTSINPPEWYERNGVTLHAVVLGLEAARGLLERGLDVHVVHLRSHLMEMQLDAAAGHLLRTTLEQMGVKVHLDKTTSEVLGEERVEGLAFADGSTLPADMVVVS